MQIMLEIINWACVPSTSNFSEKIVFPIPQIFLEFTKTFQSEKWVRKYNYGSLNQYLDNIIFENDILK